MNDAACLEYLKRKEIEHIEAEEAVQECLDRQREMSVLKYKDANELLDLIDIRNRLWDLVRAWQFYLYSPRPYSG